MPERDLLARAGAWMEVDPDPDTRAEIQALIDADDRDAIAERFDGRLEFGTAGLRGPMGGGPRRMNRVVVQRAAAGLMDVLGAGTTVVVGHDAREKSDVFASDTARVVAAAGGTAIVLPGPVPTPLVAFAVLALGADGGVVCTASHNPRGDNGFKVYLGDGAQVRAPVDRQIAAAIDDIGDEAVELADADDPAVRVAGPELADTYLERALGLLEGSGARQVEIVYTPLHGVGAALTTELFARAGFGSFHVVAAQAVPDGSFPTVAFPNPEEPGALDLAVAEATARGADLVLAHDPDADRLGVAVPRDGVWHVLSGDEIGALLADHLLARTSGDDRLVVDTVVSSGILERLAAEHGVRHVRTLTGFKWVVRPAIDHPDWHFVFGYEEALGFAVTDWVRDKDGVTAGLVFAHLVAEAAARGETVWDRLESIARRHGLHATATWSVRFDGPGADRRAAEVLARLRLEPPALIGSHSVVGIDDLLEGGSLPPTDGLVFHLADGARLTVRPSGTEPKVKAYARVIVEVADTADSFGRARADAAHALAELNHAITTLFSA